MLCSVELVGVVVEKGITENEIPYLTLNVERPFLSQAHESIYDQFIVFGWGGIMNELKCYYEIGDYLCVKGRLENHDQFKVIVIGEYVKLIYRNKQR